MKNLSKFLGIIALLPVALLLSCASVPANSLGEVQAVFESPDRIRTLGSGINQAAHQAGQQIGAGAARGDTSAMRSGGVVALILFPVALTMDIINIPASTRLNRAAREALLEVARTRHGGNVDVTRVRRYLWTLPH